MNARLDVLLAQKFQISRGAAREAILAGYVKIEERLLLKPGQMFSEAELEAVTLLQNPQKFVSRGGNKLQAALDAFGVSVAGLVCLDVGASTGGFTDCLLKNHARKVYAIDNGKNQLAAVLLQDPRVISREETDIREASCEWHSWMKEPPQFACIDVSFISLTKVLAPTAKILAPGAELICLIKPQFEAGRGKIKRGLVNNEKIRLQAVDAVRDYTASSGLQVVDIFPVPMNTGIKKNQEYLMHCKISTGYKV